MATNKSILVKSKSVKDREMPPGSGGGPLKRTTSTPDSVGHPSCGSLKKSHSSPNITDKLEIVSPKTKKKTVFFVGEKGPMNDSIMGSRKRGVSSPETESEENLCLLVSQLPVQENNPYHKKANLQVIQEEKEGSISTPPTELPDSGTIRFRIGSLSGVTSGDDDSLDGGDGLHKTLSSADFIHSNVNEENSTKNENESDDSESKDSTISISNILGTPFDRNKMYEDFKENGNGKDTSNAPAHVSEKNKRHKLFIQLNELYLPDSPDGEMQWWETARWVKYEEDVEAGAERWGRPHVASLSFHSLLELRHCIEYGCVILGVQSHTLAGLSRTVVERMVMEGHVNREDAQAIVRAILLPHRKVQDRHSGHPDLKMQSSYNSLENFFYRTQSFMSPVPETLTRRTSSVHVGHHRVHQVQHSDQDQELFRKRTQSHPVVPQLMRDPSYLTPPSLPKIDRQQSIAFKLLSHPAINEEEEIDPDLVPPRSPRNRRSSETPSIKIHMSPEAHEEEKSSTSCPTKVLNYLCQRKGKKGSKSKPSEDRDLKRRIALGTEGGIILVGAVDFLEKVTVAFIRLDHPLQLPNVTEIPIPVRFIVLLLGPLTAGIDFHEVGRSICTLLSTKSFQESAYTATKREELLMAIHEFLDYSIVLPPGDWDPKALLPFQQIKAKAKWLRKRRKQLSKIPFAPPSQLEAEEADVHGEEHHMHDPLPRTGRLFGRMIDELKHRFPMYKSDITDGFNLQSARCVLFIFFACFLPALTFGTILSSKTNGFLGVKESLVSTGFCGIIFSLFSAQPLLMLGVSGPMLIFEQTVFELVEKFGDPSLFLAVRIWVALWAFTFCVILVALDGASLIKYFSRFTDDIVETMVSIVFISECVKYIQKTYQYNPVKTLEEYCSQNITTNNTSAIAAMVLKDGKKSAKESGQPNVAVLCTVLVIATFILAVVFSKIRNSTFFGRQVRRAIGDFGMSLAVLVIVILDVVLLDDQITAKVSITSGFQPTHISRHSWLVIPWPVPKWVIGVSFVAGLLLFFVLFIEMQVGEMMLDKKELGLVKGKGYHWDMLLSGALLVLTAFFGVPWLCAGPVRSTSHLHSLTVYKIRAPGQSPKVERVIEQRVTSLVLSILISLSVLPTGLLQMIPKAVLFGVFLYLGVMSMQGVQMISRTVLFFIPVKYHPAVIYTLRTQTHRMNVFTCVQLILLALVTAVKMSQAIAFLFPLAIIFSIVCRWHVLPQLFTNNELAALDSHDEERTDEMDFYSHAQRIPSFYARENW